MSRNELELKIPLPKPMQIVCNGEEAPVANNIAPVVDNLKTALQKPARKPGAWAKLPKAALDWDAPQTNAIISDALTGVTSR